MGASCAATERRHPAQFLQTHCGSCRFISACVGTRSGFSAPYRHCPAACVPIRRSRSRSAPMPNSSAGAAPLTAHHHCHGKPGSGRDFSFVGWSDVSAVGSSGRENMIDVTRPIHTRSFLYHRCDNVRTNGARRGASHTSDTQRRLSSDWRLHHGGIIRCFQHRPEQRRRRTTLKATRQTLRHVLRVHERHCRFTRSRGFDPDPASSLGISRARPDSSCLAKRS